MFQDLVNGEGLFGDLEVYGEFLGYSLPEKKDFLEVGKGLFQSEVHRIFPAEREVMEREKCFIFDCHILVFETESNAFKLFCKSLALNFYFPIIVDLREILQKCSSDVIFRLDRLSKTRSPETRTRRQNNQKHLQKETHQRKRNKPDPRRPSHKNLDRLRRRNLGSEKLLL